jgi:4-hydroxy-tetrahydrodipicolinate synthase
VTTAQTATATQQRLTGVIPPVVTPFTADHEVDVPSLERLVDFLIAGGVDGLFVLGSTSEVAFLTDRQRALVVDTVIARVAGRVPVLVGVIDMTTPRVVDHATVALKSGCDGIVATAPFYTRTHPAEIAWHFRMLHDQIGLPVYAYDLPVSVHVKLDGAMMLDLAAEGVLAGVKDSSGDEGGLRKIVVDRADRGDSVAGFTVLTGSETTVDAALSMGADGVVPGLGNVDPGGYARLYRLARAGQWDAARDEQVRLMRLMEIVHVGDPARIGRGSSALGAFKAALKLRGVIDSALTSPPQLPLADPEIERVRGIVAAAGLL